MKLLCVLLLIFATNIFAVVTDEELELIDEMLREVGLTIESVNFPKNWESCAFSIPIMLEILEKPFEYPKLVESLKNELLGRDFLKIYDTANSLVFSELFPSVYDENEIFDYKTTLFNKLVKIKKPNDLFNYFEFVYDISMKFYQDSFVNLSFEELKHLELLIYNLTKMGDEDNHRYAHLYEGVTLPEEANDMEYYVELIYKINFSALMLSGKYFHQGMILLSEIEPFSFGNKKPIIKRSKIGNMVIGTRNDDNYSDDFIFVYDPAGNDTYCFNISTSFSSPFLAVLDFVGDDRYINGNISGLFASFYGHIFHFDGSGNDYYKGDDFTFSANFGSMLSIDGGGDDVYVTGKKTLGAGSFGIALLMNIGGNNYFSGTCFTQGFAGTLGYGLLASYAGEGTNNDVYFAGGKYIDVLRDSTDYYSLSQGFGFGVRPYMAGGIGILFDEKGNDFYNGAVFSQGVAYWYALGILIDLQGNDFYNACWYPQGSGIHYGAGFLFEGDGDDMYYSKRGPGQGGAHDYGVGFLIDRGGNDSYSADGNCGFAITNSVAVFIDSAGNDRYERKRYDSYGHGGISRDMGSIGIFLDTAGSDSYANHQHGNNSTWTSGFYGVGKDLNIVKETPESVVTTIEEVPEEIILLDPDTPINELFSIAAQWGIVTNSKERLAHARKLLLERDLETTEYIIDMQLNTGDISVLQAILDYARQSEAFKTHIASGLNKTKSREISNTILFIGLLRLDEQVDELERLLNIGLYEQDILLALGRLKTDKSVDILSSYLNSSDQYKRVTAARGLKELGTERSLNLLFTLENEDNFLIKSLIDIVRAEQ